MTESLVEFWAMGGYAFYVWTSLALTAVVLILNIVIPRMRFRSLIQQLKDQWRREDALSK